MGGSNSTQHEPPVININVNVANKNENNNTVDKKKKKKKDRKRKPSLCESDEEPIVKSDKESRSYLIEDEKNDPNVNKEQISNCQESKKINSPIPGKEGLALKPTKFYKDKMYLSP